MGSNAREGSYLSLRDNLDARARRTRGCGRNLASILHTNLKRCLEVMLKAAAANAGRGISDVRTEKPGMVAGSSRPGEVFFD
eukprot:CAMPEP_0185760768 /NCGR_PEP_ID=MMETSP1174-20130828/19694_1 /TAXON_ID=35687 /ORGANISM="Dictyocha speculum, Strain CCMP1381" /LENGTH=81 /DNA_ID=CAMNT_0028441727 /DNA_START=246 /DNA_END=491 /DNA_ORIENTATION=+